MTPVPTQDAVVVADIEKAIPPPARVWFLAGGGGCLVVFALITYVAALCGNHQAQSYLTTVVPGLATFLVGWLGVRSPFLA